ncbi:hypothetical protein ABIC65_001071 [Sphingomonas trueperi]|uniref:hypothetical protein n=1 Tax=Sphingomonas trueperi TaxID=53317 RepID=UPI003394ADCF
MMIARTVFCFELAMIAINSASGDVPHTVQSCVVAALIVVNSMIADALQDRL